jgi:hypothetical protein
VVSVPVRVRVRVRVRVWVRLGSNLRGGEGAGLVRAQHDHRCDLLERRQVGDDAALLGHLLGADGEGDLHDHGERDRDRGDGKRERHLEDLLELLATEAHLHRVGRGMC